VDTDHPREQQSQHRDTQEPEDGMKLLRTDLVQMLHSQGANATANRAAAELPEEVDTERDRDLLAQAGLSHDQLMGRLAGASIRIIG
jgi:hypothetical protein